MLCRHSRLIPLDPFIIWVPCFVPEFHFPSSWALCSFLALLKILIKYFCTAQIKSVFRTKTWKNWLWLVLSNRGPLHSPAICLFYNSELIEIRVGWWFCLFFFLLLADPLLLRPNYSLFRAWSLRSQGKWRNLWKNPKEQWWISVERTHTTVAGMWQCQESPGTQDLAWQHRSEG